MNLLTRFVINKYSTKEGRILAYLRHKGAKGATQQELNNIHYRYGSSIHELRKEGHNIISQRLNSKGKWMYFYTEE